MTLGPIALSAFMLAGQGADAVSTQRALDRCAACYEANPLMRNEAVRWSAKGVVVAGGTVAVIKLWPRHKKSAIAVAAIVGGAGFALAAHNERVSR